MKAIAFLIAFITAVSVVPAALPKDTADIGPLLEPIRKEHNLPALAAAVISDNQVIALAAVGERKYGSGVNVTADDKFHLGSCTKAMTATIVAMLIEQGKLDWDTTLAQALPNMPMLEEYKAVTIRHLLSHRAGLPNESWPTGKTFMDMHNLPGPPRQQRLAYAEMILNQEPSAKPGEKYIYSNAGFSIAGVIAEEATDTPWEDLIRKMLFEPLDMKTAGFGAMGTKDNLDQPWQHKLDSLGKKKSIEPGRYSDNPPVIGPGGIVHCSMNDWAKFIILHLNNGTCNGKKLLTPETINQLRKPCYDGDYAGGWKIVDRSWGGGRVFTHSGTNNKNYAVVWMAPNRNYAVLVATNQGGSDETKAVDQVAAMLIEKFKPKTTK